MGRVIGGGKDRGDLSGNLTLNAWWWLPSLNAELSEEEIKFNYLRTSLYERWVMIERNVSFIEISLIF